MARVGVSVSCTVSLSVGVSVIRLSKGLFGAIGGLLGGYWGQFGLFLPCRFQTNRNP